MTWVTLKRIFRSGFVDFWRNGFVSVSSVVIMTFTLFIIGFTIFSGVILNTTLAQFRDKADVTVYFIPNAPEDQILALQKQLSTLPEVASASYTSQDDSLAQFKARHQNDQLTLQALDELGGNPLGATLEVKAKDISQYDAIAQFLQQQQALSTGQTAIIDKVNYFDEQHRGALDRIAAVTAATERIGLVLIIILVVITIAICLNTIRLAIYTSREEIAVMRLVGAGQSYIRAPFLVEGVLYGLVAGVLTLLLFYPLTYWLGNATENFFGGVNVFSYYLGHFPFFLLVILGTGVLLGALASFLAVRRYLKI